MPWIIFCIIYCYWLLPMSWPLNPFYSIIWMSIFWLSGYYIWPPIMFINPLMFCWFISMPPIEEFCIPLGMPSLSSLPSRMSTSPCAKEHLSPYLHYPSKLPININSFTYIARNTCIRLFCTSDSCPFAAIAMGVWINPVHHYFEDIVFLGCC